MSNCLPPSTPTRVRLARPADVGAMFHIRTSVTENALALEQLAQLGITPEAVRLIVQSSPTCAWVAEAGDGEVVGFSMVDLPQACLFAAFVLPGCEARGLGRQLVAACEAAQFAHHPVAWLETARHSRAAGFYRHLGWGHETDVGGSDIRLEKRRPL